MQSVRDAYFRNIKMLAVATVGVILLSAAVSWISAGKTDAFATLTHRNLDRITVSPGHDCELLHIPANAFVQLVGVERGGAGAPVLVASHNRQMTGLVNLLVSRNNKPVFLLLSAEQPVLWNIQKAEDTTIAGIAVISHVAQVVANVPAGITPIFVTRRTASTWPSSGRICPMLGIPTRADATYERFKRRLQEHFGRTPDNAIFRRGHRDIRIGPRRNFAIAYKPIDAAALYGSGPVVDARPERRDAALAELLEDGRLLRLPPSALFEVKKIVKAAAPRASLWALSYDIKRGRDILVPTAKVALPAGMTGNKAATFLIPEDIAAPLSPPSHNKYIPLPLPLNEIIHLM